MVRLQVFTVLNSGNGYISANVPHAYVCICNNVLSGTVLDTVECPCGKFYLVTEQGPWTQFNTAKSNETFGYYCKCGYYLTGKIGQYKLCACGVEYKVTDSNWTIYKKDITCKGCGYNVIYYPMSDAEAYICTKCTYVNILSESKSDNAKNKYQLEYICICGKILTGTKDADIKCACGKVYIITTSGIWIDNTQKSDNPKNKYQLESFCICGKILTGNVDSVIECPNCFKILSSNDCRTMD